MLTSARARVLPSKAWGFVKEILEDFVREKGGIMAAAVSFYVFVSLIPILLIAVAVSSYFLGSTAEAEAWVVSRLRQYSPALSAESGVGAVVVEAVREVVDGRGVATGLGLLALLWSATSAIGNLAQAINVAWNVQEARGYLMGKLIGFLTFVAVALLLGASIGVTAAINAIRSSNLSLFGVKPSEWPLIWSLLGYLIPLVVAIGTFTIVYKIMPNTSVPLRIALLGGVFAGILWELAKYGFSYYVSRVGDFSSVYGSLGGVILLLVWINYSSIVTILGADVASLTHRRMERARRGH